MHRFTLRQRLILVVLVPALLLAAGLTAFLLQRANAAADAALRDRALAIVSFLAPAAEYGVISGNRHALESLLEAVLAQRDVVAASIVDGHGDLLASSGRRSLDAHTLPATTSAATPHVLRVGTARLAAVAPVELDAPRLGAEAARRPGALRPVVGWVHVELDTTALEDEKRHLFISTLVISGAVLGLTLLLALGLSGAVSRPLTRLATVV